MSLPPKAPRHLIQYNTILYCTIWCKLCNIQLIIYRQKQYKQIFDEMDEYNTEIYKEHWDFCCRKLNNSVGLNISYRPSAEQGLFIVSYVFTWIQFSNSPSPFYSHRLTGILTGICNCTSSILRYVITYCPACRTSLIATRFWVVMICPIIKCLTVLEFSLILFDLCLFITIFNFILNYVPIVTFWILTYHKIWILLIIFCFIWSYWIIYFLTCLEVFWSVVS